MHSWTEKVVGFFLFNTENLSHTSRQINLRQLFPKVVGFFFIFNTENLSHTSRQIFINYFQKWLVFFGFFFNFLSNTENLSHTSRQIFSIISRFISLVYKRKAKVITQIYTIRKSIVESLGTSVCHFFSFSKLICHIDIH